MAAGDAKFYGKFFQSVFNKEVDIDSDSFKMMVCKSGYTPNQDTHRYKSDVTNEASGTGYTAGGTAITGMSVSYDAGTNVLSFDGADAEWATVTLTGGDAPYWGVLYDATPGSDATRPLVGFVDLGAGAYSPNNGPFKVTWSASGIGAVTVA